ncbi:MAG: adenylate kinase [bacterium]|nr:adenylate kinase [bacterium]
MDRPVRGVLLGAPGSGKGPQAERVAERIGIPAISTGEMLREAVAAGSDLGQRVEAILNSGALVDDETMAEVVKTRLAEDDAKNGFLLDGYPRNQGQAETLAGILEELAESLDIVWFIDVPEEELVRRALARQREDDKEEVIKRRIELYREVTNPLVDFYSAMGLVERVNGKQSIDEVTEAMMKAFETRVGGGLAKEPVDA